jgi:apolipoprotein N-acyltransferase
MRSSSGYIGRRLGSIALQLFLAIAICLIVPFSAAAPDGTTRFWLTWAGLAPLFVAIKSRAGWTTAGLGFLWGGSYYLTHLCQNPVSSISTLTFVIAAGVPGLYVYLGRMFVRRYGYCPLALALGWVACEYAYAFFAADYIIFPGGKELGPILHVVVNFLGYGFIGFLVALINASLLSITDNLWAAGGWLGSPGFVLKIQPYASRDIGIRLCTYHRINWKSRAPPVDSDGVSWMRVVAPGLV